MQSYPSPNAMAADSGGPFYSQPSSQQQQPPGLSNPDELQLTAQLSRGLAPIMNTGPGGGLPEGQDPRGNLQHQYHHEQTQPHAAHLQAGPGQMDQMTGQYGASPDASNRKRSKVSRACDECRRKKIRCDATEESGDQQCTSCKRVGTRCQFSRVPMKRGPSKGYVIYISFSGANASLPSNYFSHVTSTYSPTITSSTNTHHAHKDLLKMTVPRYIKELADRLNTLEGAMQQAGDIPVQQYLHQDSPLQRRGSEEFSPPPNADNMQRKRTYSSVSGDFGTPYQPQRPATGWASQEPPRHLPHPSSSFATPQSAPPGATHVFREPNYSPNGLQPAPQWRTGPEPIRRQSSSFESMTPAEHAHQERVADWDEGIVDG